jgi:hypothetical protein
MAKDKNNIKNANIDVEKKVNKEKTEDKEA